MHQPWPSAWRHKPIGFATKGSPQGALSNCLLRSLGISRVRQIGQPSNAANLPNCRVAISMRLIDQKMGKAHPIFPSNKNGAVFYDQVSARDKVSQMLYGPKIMPWFLQG